MLKRTKVVSLLAADKPEQEVLVKGWVRTRRDAKDFSFIELNDGSCLKNIQIIANNNLANYDEVKKLTTGSSLAVTGALVESKGGSQKYEIVADKVEVYDVADEDFPLQKKSTRTNICAALHTCVRVPTNTAPLSAFVPNCLSPFTSFSMTAVFATSIRR